MKRITYLSRSHCSANDVRLLSLIRQCDQHNKALGLSGQLYITANHFLQTIEGGDEDVDNLFATIRLDDRHSDIHIIEEAFDCRQRYAGYAIAYHPDMNELVNQRKARVNGDLDLSTVCHEYLVG